MQEGADHLWTEASLLELAEPSVAQEIVKRMEQDLAFKLLQAAADRLPDSEHGFEGGRRSEHPLKHRFGLDAFSRLYAIGSGEDEEEKDVDKIAEEFAEVLRELRRPREEEEDGAVPKKRRRTSL